MLTKLKNLLLVALMFMFSAASAAETSTANQQQNSHIRSLAASCAACHGTNGSSTGITPSISNLYRPYFISQMLAFKSGQRPATVMHRHAKGLTDQEVNDLADYFAAQPRIPAKVIPHQNLSDEQSN